MATQGQDPTYGTNNYNLPKVLSVTESYARNILTLLFGRPGFYPTIPELGMNIQQYLYKFEDEIDCDEIKTKLAEQCHEFAPEIQTGAMDVTMQRIGGRTVLLFKLPIIYDDKSLSIALAVTTNENGELVYQYNSAPINQFI